mgnify:CR=1 FL=1
MSRFQTVFAARERRGALRYDVRVSAIIVPNESTTSLPCMIRDISQTGAMIDLESGPVPSEFALVFSRQCYVVRRNKDGTKIGVEFQIPWSIHP